MITFLGKNISHFLCKKNIIPTEEADIYQYGFETIFSTILGFAITLVIGFAFRRVLLAVIYYAIFVTLRQLTGGYHADSYLKCNIVFSMVTFFVLGMTRLICISQIYTILVHLLLLITTIICVWYFAPIENPNKPLTPNQKIRNHNASFVILLVLCILSIVFYAFKIEFAVLIALTLFSISILIIIEKLKGGQEEYEEGTE